MGLVSLLACFQLMGREKGTNLESQERTVQVPAVLILKLFDSSQFLLVPVYSSANKDKDYIQ